MSRTLLVIALLGLVAVATAFHINKVRTATPEGWSRLARADPRHTLSFRIALRQQNMDVLEVRRCSLAVPVTHKSPSIVSPSRSFSLLTFSPPAYGFGAR